MIVDVRGATYLLSLGLIFSIPFENIIDVPGIGTLSRSLGLLLAAAWLLGVVISGRCRAPRPFQLAVCLFALWNAASLFWSVDFDLTFEHMKTYAQLTVLSIILWDIYRSRASLTAALQAYVLGAYVAVASTLVNYFSGTSAVYQRFSGAGFNADDLGIVLALGMPLAWYLSIARPVGGRTGAALRLLNIGYFPAALFGIALSGTRTALIAALPAVVYMAYTIASSGRIKSGLWLTAGLAATAAALLTLVPPASLERLASIGSELSDGGLNGRTELWAQGFTVLWQNPLLGVGSNAYRAAIEFDNVAHNAFISVLVETGVIGFVLFATVLGLTLAAALNQQRALAWLWLSVLAIWFCGAMALTIEHRKQTWLMLNLAICSACVFPRHDATRLDRIAGGYRAVAG